MADVINTTKNKKYKFIKSLQQKKTRISEGLFVVEGKKSVIDAIDSLYTVKTIAMSESFFNENADLFKTDAEIIVINDMIFDGLCDTNTPQGVIAVLKMRNSDFLYDKTQLYVYCDNVSDPGNLGTIIRTADAAGFKGVLLSNDCTDPYSPKCVRASMGSFFNVDVIVDFSHKELISLKNETSLLCGALLSDSINYTDVDFREPCIIIVGNEANGVSQELLDISKHIIIPISGNAESLNVSIAAAILMYEAVRQRSRENE